jgi:hypothetical protein
VRQQAIDALASGGPGEGPPAIDEDARRALRGAIDRIAVALQAMRQLVHCEHPRQHCIAVHFQADGEPRLVGYRCRRCGSWSYKRGEWYRPELVEVMVSQLLGRTIEASDKEDHGSEP